MNRGWKIILIISLIGNLAIFYVAYKALEYRSHINEFLDKYLYLSEEYSSRSVYAEANKPLVADSTVNNRIVFLGTQMIKNWNLQKSFSEYETINRGVEGQRAVGYVLRFKPDVLDLAPEYVVIEISSYNFRPNFFTSELKDQVALLCDLAEYHKITPIFLSVLPPRRAFEKTIDIKELGEYSVVDSVHQFDQWMRSYCQNRNLQLVDIGALLSDSDGYLADSLASNLVEPNQAGYNLIANEIYKTLRQ